MTKDDRAAQVLAVLREIAPEVEKITLDPDRSFRDQFDFDSVDFLNFALALEQKLGMRIPELDYPRLASLTGILAYVDKRNAKGKGR